MRKDDCIWKENCGSNECKGCYQGSKFRIDVRTVSSRVNMAYKERACKRY